MYEFAAGVRKARTRKLPLTTFAEFLKNRQRRLRLRASCVGSWLLLQAMRP